MIAQIQGEVRGMKQKKDSKGRPYSVGVVEQKSEEGLPQSLMVFFKDADGKLPKIGDQVNIRALIRAIKNKSGEAMLSVWALKG